ncbi:hypothetical protein AVEN_39962-2-1, partial [Araneus ventricosus]
CVCHDLKLCQSIFIVVVGIRPSTAASTLPFSIVRFQILKCFPSVAADISFQNSICTGTLMPLAPTIAMCNWEEKTAPTRLSFTKSGERLDDYGYPKLEILVIPWKAVQNKIKRFRNKMVFDLHSSNAASSMPAC